MAFTFGFYNSLNGDRKYNAFEMSKLFDGIILDGVFEGIGQHFAVTAGEGMSVNVGTGRAWLNHTWNENDAVLPVNLPASDLNRSRYDAIVIEVGDPNTDRTNAIKVVSGTPAINPSKPVLNTGYASNSAIDDGSLPPYQHALAYILVPPAAEEITAANIEIVVGMNEMPFVTGPVETRSIEELFNQWDAQFSIWFSNLKAQLTDNVVANLQAQIDASVKYSDKATDSEALAGTSDSKWMTPKLVKNMIHSEEKVGVIKDSGINLENETNEYFACDGRVLTSSAYPKLFSAIGYSYGANFVSQGVSSEIGKASSSSTGINIIQESFIDANHSILCSSLTANPMYSYVNKNYTAVTGTFTNISRKKVIVPEPYGKGWYIISWAADYAFDISYLALNSTTATSLYSGDKYDSYFSTRVVAIGIQNGYVYALLENIQTTSGSSTNRKIFKISTTGVTVVTLNDSSQNRYYGYYSKTHSGFVFATKVYSNDDFNGFWKVNPETGVITELSTTSAAVNVLKTMDFTLYGLEHYSFSNNCRYISLGQGRVGTYGVEIFTIDSYLDTIKIDYIPLSIKNGSSFPFSAMYLFSNGQDFTCFYDDIMVRKKADGIFNEINNPTIDSTDYKYFAYSRITFGDPISDITICYTTKKSPYSVYFEKFRPEPGKFALPDRKDTYLGQFIKYC